MTYTVSPTAEEHFSGLFSAIDAVAREKQFLAFLQAPAYEESLAFYRRIVDQDLCQFVALEGKEVVGWCDILPTHGESRAHVGRLGIGLILTARHKGLGARLIDAALLKAQTKGMTRVELIVRCDNLNAKVLYEKFGFVVEGLQRNSSLIEGQYYDAFAMALLC